ncbi:hypothetical protein HXX76_015740 [Chlamydomonas incerta]|uniref:Uncharacterized protein n=1 Tax=Chlamydomonas incerta TaxID=51695 RepID=A0A835SG53_CHLIN|nr:hypothetical protein HXX76_015740 [Chlamydomonas incerta]|eukprot:KAG2422793.1 hypothetical protein HXX76_015740 [Chlamydomonas incerta]
MTPAAHGNRLNGLLRQYGPHVAALHLGGCPWLNVTGLDYLARWAAAHGNRLNGLLRQYGPHVAALHLGGCPWLNVTGLDYLARCTRLVHLDMTGCSQYSVDAWGALCRHCPQLKSLVVRGCSRLCEPAIIQELFDTPDSQRLALEHLDMQGLLFLQDAASLGAELGHCLERLAGPAAAGQGAEQGAGAGGGGGGGGRRRRRGGVPAGVAAAGLDGRGGGGAGGAPVGAGGPAAPPPPQLYVGDLRPVLGVVRRAGACLRLLDLAGCWSPHGDLALPAALAACSVLEALCLSNWQGGPGVGEALRRLPSTRLRHLNLRAVVPLTDADLLPLLGRCGGRLQALNVGCCGRLSDAVLAALAASCGGSLTALDVCYAEGMTAAGVRAVAAALPRLTEFGFSGFAGLEDVDIAAVVGRLHHLTMLGIGGIPRLTDASLRALAASPCVASGRLAALYAADLPNITLAGVEQLLRAAGGAAALAPAAGPAPAAAGGGGGLGGGGGGLRQLELSRCAQVPAAELAALLAALPGPGGSGCRRYVFNGDMLPAELVAEINPYLRQAAEAEAAATGAAPQPPHRRLAAAASGSGLGPGLAAVTAAVVAALASAAAWVAWGEPLASAAAAPQLALSAAVLRLALRLGGALGLLLRGWLLALLPPQLLPLLAVGKNGVPAAAGLAAQPAACDGGDARLGGSPAPAETCVVGTCCGGSAAGALAATVWRARRWLAALLWRRAQWLLPPGRQLLVNAVAALALLWGLVLLFALALAAAGCLLVGGVTSLG